MKTKLILAIVGWWIAASVAIDSFAQNTCESCAITKPKNMVVNKNQLKSMAIGYTLKERGDSAVLWSDNLVMCCKEHGSYFVRSNAYVVLYYNRLDSCKRAGMTSCPSAESAKAHSLRNIGEAEALFQPGNPGDPAYVNALAFKHEEFGDTVKAKEVFRNSLAMKPVQPDIYYHLISLANNENDHHRVSYYFSRLVNATRDITDVLNYIEQVLRSLPEAKYNNDEFSPAEKQKIDSILVKADSLWNAFAPMFANDYNFRYKQLKIKALQEKFKESCTLCESLIADYPVDSIKRLHQPSKDTVYFLCAEINVRADSIKTALSYYDKVIELTSGREVQLNYFHRMRAVLSSIPQFFFEDYLYLKKFINGQRMNKKSSEYSIAQNEVNEFETSIALIKKMISDNNLDWDSLGNLYASIGDFQNARIAFINLLRQDKTDINRLKVAKAEFRLHNFEESLFYLEKIESEDESMMKEKRMLNILNLKYQADKDPDYCSRFSKAVEDLDPVELKDLCPALIRNRCLPDVCKPKGL